jgi:ParB family chromosome partitioning protein
MAKKPINERCPLQSECGRKKCEFQFHESECNYYIGNSRPGYEIPDQEAYGLLQLRKKEG